MGRARWPGIALAALVGAGLGALLQWMPQAQGCIEQQPKCPGPIAGHVTVTGMLVGALATVAAWLLLSWLNGRQRQRRHLSGEE